MFLSKLADPKYSLGDCLLPNLTSTKDLEVTIDNRLHFYEHISIITGRARARAYMIHKCYIYRNTQPLVRRFVAYVRPILEYTSSTWSPSTITNIKMVESVQKRFTKRLKRLHKVDYQNRLIALGLDSLELSRLSAGLTLTYKILFGLIDVDPTIFLTFITAHHCAATVIDYTATHNGLILVFICLVLML